MCRLLLNLSNLLVGTADTRLKRLSRYVELEVGDTSVLSLRLASALLRISACRLFLNLSLRSADVRCKLGSESSLPSGSFDEGFGMLLRLRTLSRPLAKAVSDGPFASAMEKRRGT